MPTLSISSETVCYLIVKLRGFDVQDVETDPDDASNPSDDRMVAVLEQHPDDPTAQEIAGTIAALDDDQRGDLLGLLRLGRGDGGLDEWEAMRGEAMREHGARIVPYLLGQPLAADHLEEALSLFGFSCAEFEMDRL